MLCHLLFLCIQYNTIQYSHLADAFIQSDVQKMLVEERKVNMSLDPRPVSGTLYGLEAGLQPIGTDFYPMVTSSVSQPIDWIY